MHYKILTALSAVALIAVPATAQQSQAKGRQAAKDAVYCLQFSAETGSRINRLECKTKKDWERLGVEFGQRRSN